MFAFVHPEFEMQLDEHSMLSDIQEAVVVRGHIKPVFAREPRKSIFCS